MSKHRGILAVVLAAAAVAGVLMWWNRPAARFDYDDVISKVGDAVVAATGAVGTVEKMNANADLRPTFRMGMCMRSLPSLQGASPASAGVSMRINTSDGAMDVEIFRPDAEVVGVAFAAGDSHLAESVAAHLSMAMPRLCIGHQVLAPSTGS